MIDFAVFKSTDDRHHLSRGDVFKELSCSRPYNATAMTLRSKTLSRHILFQFSVNALATFSTCAVFRLFRVMLWHSF